MSSELDTELAKGIYVNVGGSWFKAFTEFNEATGGTVSTYTKSDGTKWKVHTFTSNDTFTVTKAARPFRVLLVGGGAGGSGYNPSCCGGSGCERGSTPGGGGNHYYNNSLSIGKGDFPVVVGGGGGPGRNGCCQAGPCDCCKYGPGVRGGFPGGNGGATTFDGHSGAGGTGAAQMAPVYNHYITSDIQTGTDKSFGHNGGGGSKSGGKGVAIIAYQIANTATEFDDNLPPELPQEGRATSPEEIRAEEIAEIEQLLEASDVR
mgnify:CR=1 FL=1